MANLPEQKFHRPMRDAEQERARSALAQHPTSRFAVTHYQATTLMGFALKVLSFSPGFSRVHGEAKIEKPFQRFSVRNVRNR
jgi:hypothetical protein